MIDVIMPKMGESITEGTILEWKKKVGDSVELDEMLLEISTDKVDSEIPSPAAGVIAELLFGVSDVVEVGEVIARIRKSGEQISADPAVSETKDTPITELHPGIMTDRVSSHKTERLKTSPLSGTMGFISPLVRSIAEKEGVTSEELARISGNGHENRITKKDIIQFLENRKKNHLKDSSVSQSMTDVTSDDTISDSSADQGESLISGSTLNDRRYSMDRIRRKIADHMIASQQISAHVYSTSEADVTPLVNIRLMYMDWFRAKQGISLTYSPMIMYAATRAIKEFPIMNSSIDGYEVVSHKHINMGFAVALPDNNLIVPVIRRCEELNFLGMARQSAAFAEKARNGQLSPEDVFGSTFTITNPGVFGGLSGMAIINQPNVGILSVGTFQKRPVVKETKYGDTIVVRTMVYLTLSYDHRLIDGAYGTRFLSRICELLETFEKANIG